MRKCTTYSGLCSEMSLSEYSGQFVIEPTDGKFHQILSFDRTDGRFQLFGKLLLILVSGCENYNILTPVAYIFRIAMKF